MKIILAILIATTTFGHSNHSIDNGYDVISRVSGIQVQCQRCGHRLDENKLCDNKDCNAYGYDK